MACTEDYNELPPVKVVTKSCYYENYIKYYWQCDDCGINDTISKEIYGENKSDALGSTNFTSLASGSVLYATNIITVMSSLNDEYNRRKGSSISWPTYGYGTKITADLINTIRSRIQDIRPSYDIGYSTKNQTVIYIDKYNSACSYINILRNECICNCAYCTCNCDNCACNCNYCTCHCYYCYDKEHYCFGDCGRDCGDGH